MTEDPACLLLALFAELLEYPNAATLRRAAASLEQLKAMQPEAARLLEDACRAAEERGLAQMEELYTSTFDMHPICYPYLGYQLFGETYKRGAFMARLNEAYREAGFSAGKELPDHVSVVLRFLALDISRRQDGFGQALLHDGLAPTLEKMTQALGKQVDNPYTGVVSALLLVLAATPEMEMHHA